MTAANEKAATTPNRTRSSAQETVMKNLKPLVALLALASPAAFAGSDRGFVDHERHLASDQIQLASATEPAPGVSTSDKPSGIFAQSLRDEVLGISPQVGVIGYADLNGLYTSRMAEGLNLNFNVIPLVSQDAKDYYAGISTGIFYAHLGSHSSNFFGANADASDFTSSGSNLAVIPVDLKIGYNVSDSLRLSAHGGGNLTYRSVASTADFGTATSGNDQEAWRIFPNAGADLEWTVAKDVTLTARPDFTGTEGRVLYMTTVGIVAPLSF